MTALIPDITLATDEAHAVLSLIEKRKSGSRPEPSDWQQLFDSQGYRRLKARQAAMGSPIEDSQFRVFIESSDLMTNADDLHASLQMLKELDLQEIANAALAYLPVEASLRGTIYPVIKPRQNSFVFELETDPALFLALGADMQAAPLANTLIHELHHWGLASCSPNQQLRDRLALSPQPVRLAFEALGSFGEGLAMLAAAGGPDVHPHEASAPGDRARWDRDMANFAEDLCALEAFFHEILDGKYEDEHALLQASMPFFGIQGAWYTVGYKMAQSIELAHGRGALIDGMGDPRNLLCQYNEIAEDDARWSKRLVERLFANEHTP